MARDRLDIYDDFLQCRYASESLLMAYAGEANSVSFHIQEAVSRIRKCAEHLGYDLTPRVVTSAPVFDGRDSSIGLTERAINEAPYDNASNI